MDLVNAIRKLGFKKWYERQLVESHLYLVTCFLCMVMVAACMEQLSFRAPGIQPLLNLAAIGGGGLLGLFAWARYRTIMMVASRYSEHSTCEHCGAYARFDVTDWGAPDPEAGTWMKVRCRRCGHLWTLD